jgi:hypothetical protein
MDTDPIKRSLDYRVVWSGDDVLGKTTPPPTNGVVSYHKNQHHPGEHYTLYGKDDYETLDIYNIDGSTMSCFVHAFHRDEISTFVNQLITLYRVVVMNNKSRNQGRPETYFVDRMTMNRGATKRHMNIACADGSTTFLNRMYRIWELLDEFHYVPGPVQDIISNLNTVFSGSIWQVMDKIFYAYELCVPSLIVGLSHPLKFDGKPISHYDTELVQKCTSYLGVIRSYKYQAEAHMISVAYDDTPVKGFSLLNVNGYVPIDTVVEINETKCGFKDCENLVFMDPKFRLCLKCLLTAEMSYIKAGCEFVS